MRSSGNCESWGALPLPVLCLLFCSATPALGGDAPPEFLDVHTDPGGGVIATARVLFPASPATVYSLLADFSRWPELFQTGMRVVDLQIRNGVATTDLRIEHALLPGERRLVTESRTTADRGIVTDLVGGDFKRYHRVWKFSPMNEGRETSADFELSVAIDSLVPDWLVAMATRRELETHFRIVKEKVRVPAVRPEK
jgi:ribosome-associated toxin RatA of RatAB toxin-antitoxin module